MSLKTAATVLADKHTEAHNAVVDPVVHFGALGNSSFSGGGADDTAALQNSVDAALGGAMPGGVPTPTRYGYDGAGHVRVPAGFFRLTAPLVFRGVRGLLFEGAGREATIFVVDGTVAQALQLLGVSYSAFRNFSIVGAGDFAGTGHATYGISLDWDPALTISSSSRNHFENIWVRNLDVKYPYAIGPDSVNYDVSNTKWVNCHASGNFVQGSGNTTKFQAGFLVGSGVSGNALNHYFEDCHNLYLRRGYHVQSVDNVAITNGDSGYLEDFVYKTGPGSVAIRDTRVEETWRLALSGGAAGFTSHLLADNIGWRPGGSGEANGRMVDWQYTGSVLLRALHTSIPTNNSLTQHVRVSVAAGKPVHVRLEGASVGGLTTLSDFVEASGASEVYFDSFGVNGIDSSGGLVTQFPAAYISYTNAEARINPKSIRVGTSTGPLVLTGTGTPEAAVTAPVGSLFLRTDSATSLYVKQTGAGNTGWVAK